MLAVTSKCLTLPQFSHALKAKRKKSNERKKEKKKRLKQNTENHMNSFRDRDQTPLYTYRFHISVSPFRDQTITYLTRCVAEPPWIAEKRRPTVNSVPLGWAPLTPATVYPPQFHPVTVTPTPVPPRHSYTHSSSTLSQLYPP